MKNVSECLKAIRHKERPNAKYYIENIFPDFLELCGDRLYGDDPSILGGIATFQKQPVTVIGQLKGRNLKENIEYNFSMSKPEGFRKALRLMKQANKFNRPVICFVDTIGADPSEEAESRGQNAAIANILMEMMYLEVPIVSILIGDGGSGGALALCVSNEVVALENAVLSVISPKACSNILWRNSNRESDAANLLKITADDLKKFNVIDKIILEPETGAHCDPPMMAKQIQLYLQNTLLKYKHISKRKLVHMRVEKFRNIGLGMDNKLS